MSDDEFLEELKRDEMAAEPITSTCDHCGREGGLYHAAESVVCCLCDDCYEERRPEQSLTEILNALPDEEGYVLYIVPKNDGITGIEPIAKIIGEAMSAGRVVQLEILPKSKQQKETTKAPE